MKKEMLAVSISLILFLISISGCIETSQDKEPKMVYVDGDGGADYESIQDAIDHVIEGDTIFVRNGNYHETLLIDKSINLIGESKDKTIIHYNKTKGSTDSDSVVIINADNCKIRGLKIISVNYSLGMNMIGINIDSSNNIISNNIITYADKGINLKRFSKNNIIFWNNISDVRSGIFTEESDSNNISKNNISLCELYGIYFGNSENNNVSGNIISDNNHGIRVLGLRSKNNNLFRNTIMNNTRGILCCCKAEKNVIYYNNFKQNSEYSGKDDVGNQWDNGIIGNYWDDYIENHPDANQIDGIWDTPHNFTWNNMDRFPLVNPVDI